MTQIRTAYLYSGLPGAGKSTAAEIGHEFVGGTYVESGDMVRQMAADEGIEDPDSEELAEYAARQRRELGDAFFAEKIINRMLSGRFEPDFPLHLCGVRHIKSARRFREFFELAPLVYIQAPQEVRLKRLKRRGREGEAEWDMLDISRRDEIEMESLGQSTILENRDEITHVIENVGSLDDLRGKVAEVTDVVKAQEHTMRQHYDD